MDAGPRIDSYEWSGGREPMLRFGPEDGPVVVLALPLFEEANRTRAFGASILRALAVHGIGGVLPEFPGQGESELATEQARLGNLRAAFAAVSGTHAIAIRSGALIVDDRPCWLLSPQTGAELMRELTRVKGGTLDGEQVEIAGNLLSRGLLNDLGPALHPREGGDPASTGPLLGPRLRGGGVRIVRLANDRRGADEHVDGSPLWRRAEPDADRGLAETLAADIADWITVCDG